MPRESPFHTDSPEYPPTHRNVYHDNSLCDHGKAIKQEHRVSGPVVGPGVTAATPWPVRKASRRSLELSRRLFGSSANS